MAAAAWTGAARGVKLSRETGGTRMQRSRGRAALPVPLAMDVTTFTQEDVPSVYTLYFVTKTEQC